MYFYLLKSVHTYLHIYIYLDLCKLSAVSGRRTAAPRSVGSALNGESWPIFGVTIKRPNYKTRHTSNPTRNPQGTTKNPQWLSLVVLSAIPSIAIAGVRLLPYQSSFHQTQNPFLKQKEEASVPFQTKPVFFTSS